METGNQVQVPARTVFLHFEQGMNPSKISWVDWALKVWQGNQSKRKDNLNFKQAVYVNGVVVETNKVSFSYVSLGNFEKEIVGIKTEKNYIDWLEGQVQSPTSQDL